MSRSSAVSSSLDLLTQLQALHPKRIDLSLGRIHRLLDALDHPETKIPPAIHIAGTNGKGSTLAFLRAMLAPKKVHSYTSPHLVRFHERISLNGRDIDEAHLVQVLQRCEYANAGEDITFFEITTAAAFLAFSEMAADWLLLEVGLGGRLDATNVVTPQLSVITPIDLDHQDFLGDTLDKIAFEKAGIIKPGIPVISAPQQPDAARQLIAIANQCGSDLLLGGRDWQATWSEHGVLYKDASGPTLFPHPALAGAHQYVNAGSAITAARQIGLSDDQIAQGLRHAVWPARLQKLHTGPLVDRIGAQAPTCEIWLDGGHNPAAAEAITRWLCESVARPNAQNHIHILIGLLKSKDAEGFFSTISRHLCKNQAVDMHLTFHCLTIPEQENALDSGALAQIATTYGFDAKPISDPLDMSIPASTETVLICGSLYLAGWVLARHQ